MNVGAADENANKLPTVLPCPIPERNWEAIGTLGKRDLNLENQTMELPQVRPTCQSLRHLLLIAPPTRGTCAA